MRNEKSNPHTSGFSAARPWPFRVSASERAAVRTSFGHCQCVARLQRTRVAACSTSSRSAALTGSASGYATDALSESALRMSSCT